MYFKINFSKNTKKNSLLLVIFIILFPLKSYENNIGSPYIQRIILNNYGFSNNNFSIIQDFNGITYIGNTNGIIQYDGNFWEIIKVPGIPYMDVDNNGIIYVGTFNDFGFISNNNSGKPEFFSLIDSSKSELPPLNQIEQVFSHKNHIFFVMGKYFLNGPENI